MTRRDAWLALGGAAAAACLLTAGPGCETSGGDALDLRLSPSAAALTASSATGLVFTAEGGTPPYVWTVSDSALGSITSATGTAIYSAAAGTGTNTVTVTDAESASASAVVTQT